MTPRLTQLRAIESRTPDDPFIRYAIALELLKSKDTDGALDYLARTLAVDADYLYAYYQQGQILEKRGDVPAAKSAYDAGIVRARAKGDNKALSELKAARDFLD
jgi:tetratricopeptide (TPR) repeat protein